jgi:hypothetical protein
LGVFFGENQKIQKKSSLSPHTVAGAHINIALNSQGLRQVFIISLSPFCLKPVSGSPNILQEQSNTHHTQERK